MTWSGSCRSRRPNQRGSAGLALLWVAVATVGLTTSMVVWGAAVVARHRAERVADFAALAAAATVADPCSAAAQVASAGRTRLALCQVLGDSSVLVVVEVSLPPVLQRLVPDLPPARARARAGVELSP